MTQAIDFQRQRAIYISIDYMLTIWLEQKWFEPAVLQQAAPGAFQNDFDKFRDEYRFS